MHFNGRVFGPSWARRALTDPGALQRSGWRVIEGDRLDERLKALHAGKDARGGEDMGGGAVSCDGAGGGDCDDGGGAEGGAKAASCLMALHETGVPLERCLEQRAAGMCNGAGKGSRAKASRIGGVQGGGSVLVLGDHKGFTTDEEVMCVPLPFECVRALKLVVGRRRR